MCIMLLSPQEPSVTLSTHISVFQAQALDLVAFPPRQCILQRRALGAGPAATLHVS